ncbi:hypothetical protein L249_7995 [Ophiocordyceps polyrhachis-furcata BCC 54312]|uniref:J domain-containing protein n=1 Tax=Ophiocordyceps polyrhachis-furcata BCC 54312 TaxID=1330021 RepID=A0A367LHW5_9HYPO|nr:hypothetical protein L249_7995 [Ophiocordyceps polyrhachis-furcata BCC 54312]
MGDRPSLSSSPKSRHTRSWMNTHRARRQSCDIPIQSCERPLPTEARPPMAAKPVAETEGDPLRPRATRIRLKKHRTSAQPTSGSHQRRHGHRRRHHHHHHHHHHHSRSPTPEIPGPPPLDAETAFRESLFDAMADDEAAAYWEGVYGQPIHVYSNEKVGPQGELERMTDDEYAAYVRQKMYEKTHAGMLEEKARREERKKQEEREARERRRQRKESARQSRKLEEEAERRSRKLQEDVERSIRHGEARRQRKIWTDYVDAWATWNGDVAKLPWPVEGSRRRGLNEADVRAFFVNGLDLESIGAKNFVAGLKEERVRWHPDKVQQRLGGRVDSDVMKNVTAVFQIIDRIWGEMRKKLTDD